MKRMLIVMIVLLAAGCSVAQPDPTPEPMPTIMPTESLCAQDEITAYVDNFLPLFEEWLDAVDLATATARINLSPQIDNLQRIKRNITPIAHPLCLQEPHNNFTKYMEKMIDGFMGYMSGDTDAETAAMFSEANDYLNLSTEGITTISECAPNCK